MPWAERIGFALRQTLDRGRGLSVFLSRLSTIGLVLAVAVLLAVLSVMNGFEREMRDRILNLVPHVSLRGYADMATWNAYRDELSAQPGVIRASLFAEREVLVIRGQRVHAGRLLGLSPTALAVWQPMMTPASASLGVGEYALGAALAQRLDLSVGDTLRVIVPGNRGGQRGDIPLPVTGRVVAIIQTGTELDERVLIGDFSAVAGLTRQPITASGLALQLSDLFLAPELRWQLSRALPPSIYASDWTTTQGNLYAAIQLSRDLITLLLLSIIAVAAFNVVSSLVLVVTDRRGAIAMLRALGATRGDISWIFLLQGGVIGVLGASLGVIAGSALALAAPFMARGLESLLGTPLLSTDVYPLSFLPVDIRWTDAILVWVVAVTLCLLAAVLPARRAARLPVAFILANHH